MQTIFVEKPDLQIATRAVETRTAKGTSSMKQQVVDGEASATVGKLTHAQCCLQL